MDGDGAKTIGHDEPVFRVQGKKTWARKQVVAH